MPDSNQSDPAPAPSRRPRLPLWPLGFLPILGAFLGAAVARIRTPGTPDPFQIGLAQWLFAGFAAGWGAMMLGALVSLSARLGIRRFSIRAALIAIAAVAILLGMIRACAR